MSDTLKRAEELLAGITPGEWTVKGNYVLSGKQGIADYRFPDLVRGDEQPERNAEFIAAAPSLVRELVAELTSLREVVEKVREQCEREVKNGLKYQRHGYSEGRGEGAAIILSLLPEVPK